MTLAPIEAKGEVARRELSRRSFPAYCDYVHNRPLYAHQQMWASEFDRADKVGTVVISPPETLKSSTVRMYMEWCIGNDPTTTILHIMNTSTQAQLQVSAVAETITENPRYHNVFPDVTPDVARGWSHEKLFVRRADIGRPDPTIYGTGIDGPYQGAHVDLLVIDDPTDQQDVRSQTIMDQQRERLKGVLIDRLSERGRIFGILTRWGEADLVRDFREMGFTVIDCPIEGRYPWGRLLCPELFPDDRLVDIRGRKGGSLYQLTYLCDTQGAEGSMIKRQWWKRYGAIPESLEKQRPIHSWDLATKKEEVNHYTAFGSWKVGEEGYYKVDGHRERLDGDARVNKIKMLYERDKPQWVVIEEAGGSIPTVEYLQKHTRIPLMPIKPGTKDKIARVHGILPLIEAGRVWLPAQAEWVEAFIDECAQFPGGQHDDQVDETSQALAFLESRGGFGVSNSQPVFIRRT